MTANMTANMTVDQWIAETASNATMGIAVFGTATGVSYVNKTLSALLGYKDAGYKDTLPDAVLSCPDFIRSGPVRAGSESGPLSWLVHPSYSERVEKLLEKAKGPSAVSEFSAIRFLSHNGGPIPVKLLAIYIGEQKGEDVFLLIATKGDQVQFFDHAKTAARLMDDLPDAVLFADANREMLTVNPATERVFGYSADELVGKKAAMLYENEAEYIRQGQLRINMVNKGQPAIYTAQYKRKDGSIFTGETIRGIVFDDNDAMAGFVAVIRDLSDREVARRASEEISLQITEAIELMDQGFALFDKDDKLVIHNQVFKDLYRGLEGVTKIGATFEDMLRANAENGVINLPDGMDAEAWIKQRVAIHQEGTRYPRLQKLADGKWIQYSERKTKEGGRVGIHSDITALKLTEQLAHRREADLRQLTDMIPFPVMRIDRHYRANFVNKMACDWLGRPESLIQGRRLPLLLGDEAFSRIKPVVSRAFIGDDQEFETQITFPDGAVRDLHIDFVPYREGLTVTGVYAIYRDISEQSQYQTAQKAIYETINERQLEHHVKLRRLLSIGSKHLELSSSILVAQDKGGTNTDLKSHYGRDEKESASEEAAIQLFCREVYDRGDIFSAQDALSDPRIENGEQFTDTRAFIGIPVMVDGERFGCLAFYAKVARETPFTVTDRQLVRVLAEWIGNEMARQRDIDETERLQAELYKLATIDDLTQIANRRQFLTLSRREMERSRRNGDSLSLIMFDIDRFKSINDTYGHDAGDLVLRRFAEVANASLRDVDIVGRFGGEEFAALLVETDMIKAREVAERMRETMRSLVIDYRDVKISVTASFGVTQIDPQSEDLENAITRTDLALYAAKEAGRDRVSVT